MRGKLRVEKYADLTTVCRYCISVFNLNVRRIQMRPTCLLPPELLVIRNERLPKCYLVLGHCMCTVVASKNLRQIARKIFGVINHEQK